mmetsp:Transcript_24999/g.63077  ORF Transcript_24999/g.63077 Transcript_24999/m.63077 type:complete len:178 (+) Transcript_24999:95-628(+)
MSDVTTIDLDIFPGHKVAVCLVREVTNSKELKSEIKEGKFDAAFLSAEMVADKFHLLAAVAKALGAKLSGGMKTKQIHTEIIYALAGSKSIADALNNFGIADDSTDVLVVMLDKGPEDVASVLSNVEGRRAPLAELEGLCNEERLKKLFKVQAHELSLPGSSLSDIAVCRLAVLEST